MSTPKLFIVFCPVCVLTITSNNGKTLSGLEVDQGQSSVRLNPTVITDIPELDLGSVAGRSLTGNLKKHFFRVMGIWQGLDEDLPMYQ